MNFHVMTLFPEMVMAGLNTSILGRAQKKGILSVETVNIRDYTLEKHGKVDDYPYGGGAGMVMQAEPIYRAYTALLARIGRRPRLIYLTPQGRVFNQKIAGELAQEDELVFLCGHYEGVDERVLEMIVTDELSAGDYVLTGGELPAMMMIDCISRLIPGVLNNDVSAEFESFHDNLLEYPQYSRPEEFMGHRVPDILLSGHHANVEKWRREQSILRTLKKRPELLKDAVLSKKERDFLEEARKKQKTERSFCSMTKEVREFVVDKTHELIAAPSCSREAREMAEKWLAAEGTDDEAKAAKEYMAELEEDITSIDDLIALCESETGVKIFGAERAKDMAAHGKKIRAAGAKYCDCPACAAAEAILAKKAELLA